MTVRQAETIICVVLIFICFFWLILPWWIIDGARIGLARLFTKAHERKTP